MDGQDFKKAREGKGLTLLQVFIATGIMPSTINAIENNRSKDPRYRTIMVLCKFYEIEQPVIL